MKLSVAGHKLKQGFALPTVLIASVVLLTVLAVSVTSTTAARTTLKDQYYAQLAQIAGEAGVAYAKACLQQSGNIPTWTDVNPLTPSTDCNGTLRVGLTCPSDVDCFVSSDGNVRSSFSVGLPSLDSDGRALTIPQNGFVELVRESTGVVWRTYRQPSVQPTVAPGLCSGAATSSLGWTTAVLTTPAGTAFPEPRAQTIGIASATVSPGPLFFRKDFTITEPGIYTAQVKGNDRAHLYVDGMLMAKTSSISGTKTVDIELTAGCHTIGIVVLNQGIGSSFASTEFALRKNGAAIPEVVSDRTWRVAAADTVSWRDVNYFQSVAWDPARDIGAYTIAPWTSPANWSTITGDTNARWINTDHSFSGTSYPGASYAYFRSNNYGAWTLTTETEFQISAACDNACSVYIDGNEVLLHTDWASVGTANVTLGPGAHQVGLELFNSGPSNGNSAFIFSARRTSDSAVVDRSSSAWSAGPSWYGSVQSFASYSANYRPSPDVTVCNCPTQGTANVVSNPSFELDSALTSSFRATSSRTGAAAYSGTFGQRLTVNQLGFMPRLTASVIDIDPGQVYTLSAYVRASVNARIGYQFLDAQGNVLFVNGSGSELGPLSNPAGSWARYSIQSAPVPVGVYQLQMWVGVADNTSINTVFDVDALMASPGTTLYSYGDGSTSGWRWVDTPNASPSSGIPL